jgi:hypothetical protein
VPLRSTTASSSALVPWALNALASSSHWEAKLPHHWLWIIRHDVDSLITISGLKYCGRVQQRTINTFESVQRANAQYHNTIEVTQRCNVVTNQYLPHWTANTIGQLQDLPWHSWPRHLLQSSVQHLPSVSLKSTNWCPHCIMSAELFQQLKTAVRYAHWCAWETFNLGCIHFLIPHSPITSICSMNQMSGGNHSSSNENTQSSIALLLVAKWGHSPETEPRSRYLAHIGGIPRCKQATASATPPIPPPIIAMCGSFCICNWRTRSRKPDPEQFVQESRCALDEQVLSHRHSIFQIVRLPFGMESHFFADSSAKRARINFTKTPIITVGDDRLNNR